jgi:lipopolysaccharide biosynthesis glycosyltransferase
MNIFVGYDSREPIAYHVLAHSILTRASKPVNITGLTLNGLAGIYTRKRSPLESTEFSLTRFLVPYLSGYQGISLYMDCDMLCQTDITKLDANQGNDVTVVKHDYTPRQKVKMEGQQQTTYPRKNWSSLMLFVNHRCLKLTPEYVNEASALDLHRFDWAMEVGELPLEWNWLVGEYDENPDAKILHYTNGGPWFYDYSNCEQAGLWWQEYRKMQVPVTNKKW